MGESDSLKIMIFFQLRWVLVLIFSLGLTLTGCGNADDTMKNTAPESGEGTTEEAAPTNTEDGDNGADGEDGEDGDEEEDGEEDGEDEEGEDEEEDGDENSKLTPAPEGTFAASIQEVLMTSFPEQTGFEVAAVACPEDVTLESGEPFACEIQATEGFVTSVDVVTDPAAKTFDWTTKGLDIQGLEKSIASGMLEKTELKGEVDCGLGDTKNPFREEAVGSAFECTFMAEAGDRQAINVVVNDDQGNVTWNVQ
jgi:putative Ca2+/H+ antiporter (TMEM165/GDT1 family)